MTAGIIGWDIGGVNTKVARITGVDDTLVAHSHPYELQRNPLALAPLLREAARAIGERSGDQHAVTMTAELSQFFRTKREGVGFVLDAMSTSFGEECVRVFAVDGRFLDVATARAEPLAVAASNWAATASHVAMHYPAAILIDIGTTTTDIIPIVGGRVAAVGRTDPARLASGELVYTGALRTPVEAITHSVALLDDAVGVSAEGFAIAGDVHLWRGSLDPSDYTVPTPDGRPASRGFAGERLARVVCADREMLDDAAIDAIAESVAESQLESVVAAVARVRGRHPSLDIAVVAGLGDFIAAAAAERSGLRVAHYMREVGGVAATRAAPACAVALLFAERLASDAVT
jgi:probable H4MPT-linked C1 transfer pathway protein